MLRFVLILILIVFVARAFWRIVDGVLEGLGGRGRTRVPQRGVQMVRDPVCGTFIVPDQAIAIVDGSRRVFFCSTGCRDKYRAHTA
ncbi:MAG: hypothetical protein DMF91_14915 [Acidobacteria bacterium]|nr:MAG: hypothetical protein DMF91_14915 [Acidobacteriota bacterium]